MSSYCWKSLFDMSNSLLKPYISFRYGVCKKRKMINGQRNIVDFVSISPRLNNSYLHLHFYPKCYTHNECSVTCLRILRHRKSNHWPCGLMTDARRFIYWGAIMFKKFRFIPVHERCMIWHLMNIFLPFMTLLVPSTLTDSTCSFLSWRQGQTKVTTCSKYI